MPVYVELTGTVSDGFEETSAMLNISVLAAPDQAPFVMITSPGDNHNAAEAQSITFTATANDALEGDLSTGIEWSSDKDGVLGTGASLNVGTLSSGLHIISASRADSNGGVGTDFMTVTIGMPTALAQYSHNALGQRVIKVNEAASSTLHFVYDQQGRVMAEIDVATGDTLREYIYVSGQQVALVDDTGSVDEAMYFVHNDHLGTPQRITDSAKALVWAADYEPFGRATVTLATVGNNVRYPGQYSDVETGLHYNYFRDYDPGTGRYIESDPIGLSGGLNTYGYVLGNPIRYSDPSGLEVIYNGNVILNQQVRDGLSKMDRTFPNHDVIVTGGDRYRDEDGNIRSASNGGIIDGASQTSPHLYERGARAADITIPGATNSQISNAARNSGFAPGNTSHYGDGHSHVALFPSSSYNLAPVIREEFCRQNSGAHGCTPPLDDCP